MCLHNIPILKGSGVGQRVKEEGRRRGRKERGKGYPVIGLAQTNHGKISMSVHGTVYVELYGPGCTV